MNAAASHPDRSFLPDGGTTPPVPGGNQTTTRVHLKNLEVTDDRVTAQCGDCAEHLSGRYIRGGWANLFIQHAQFCPGPTPNPAKESPQ